MNTTASTLGLTLLVTALVVGMEQYRENQQEQKESAHHQAENQSYNRHPAHPDYPGFQPKRSRGQASHNHFSFTKSEQDRIEKALTLAHDRLQREHDRLHLSKQQRQAIFPLLVRSEIDYQESLPYPLGQNGRLLSLGSALSRADYENLLGSLLTPEQEAEESTQIQENDAWWSHIIGRLEEDLNNQTEIAPEPTPVPIPLPDNNLPPTEPVPEPTPTPIEPEAVVPSRSSLRGSRNLLDLLDS